ncbi:metal-dependent hydrolase family protein [Psychromicrobium lacuslunae]|uniref:Imidazolonepropionase n=1 Tax=Psychromicrobium lacuslunae TaxID=1618207 RepID=A0A0D4C0L6_9MICC|nr:amidohydrolase family protein [Psychromicrobium lacuslunae]AJT42217.1 imidazolonepropionase [Psychromicrobium lacuslunae]
MSRPFALTNASVVVGDREGSTLSETTVVVNGAGMIENIGPSSELDVPSGYRQIDLSGRFVLPGLINAHAHLFSNGKPLPPLLTSESAENLVAGFMRSFIGKRVVKKRARTNILTQLNSGVTTLRSLGDVGYEAVEVRNEIERGDYLGPRVFASGPLLAISGGHGAPQIALISDSPWEARRNVRINLRAGTTAIKISATGGVTDARAIGEAGRPQMTEEEMTAICEEAHNAGIVVAAHAQSPEGLKAALRAGVDTIEHGSSMDQEIIELFKHNPRSLHGSSALIPTLQACLPLVKLEQQVTGIDDIVRANAEMIYEEMLQGIQTARDNDITIGMGTDSALTYVTHYNTWREMDYVVRYGGLSTAAELHAATEANARILGIDQETGSVRIGKAADLLVVGSNPLTGFRALADPQLVIVRGEIIEQPKTEKYPELDEKLDSF